MGRSAVLVALGYLSAGLIRMWLLRTASSSLVQRVELSTPLNSWKRLVEGVTLSANGVDPYSGAIFHETPLTLAAFSYLLRSLSPLAIDAVFVMADLLAAFLLGKLAAQVRKLLVNEQERDIKGYHPDANQLLLNDNDSNCDVAATMTYLFHPYLVANCGARTTTVLSNLLLVSFLLATVHKRRTAACLALALATFQQFYPVMLLFPLCATLALDEKTGRTINNALGEAAKAVVTFVVAFAGLNMASYHIMGNSWNFVLSTHGFTLGVPELTPNIGLFWYFFTEMFEHFRLFFVWTFQLNCFVYVLPLTVRLRGQPFLLAWSLIALTAIFKSYPCYGDVGLYLAILPVLRHLFPYMKQIFIAGNMFVAATVLGPMMHQMWIYNGSANSNYFFAINLVFGVAQILLVTDLLFAQTKREFYLKHGFKDLQPDPADSKATCTKRLAFK